MILVFGKTGQVAMELQLLDNVVTFGRSQADLTKPSDCAELIHKHKPNAVINAAAYTAVDKAEKEEVLATTINAYAPSAMAKACATLCIPFVHISTDYVFNGNGKIPWQTQHLTDPQNAYGRSKLAGENAIRTSNATYVILRTSWVISAHRENFVKTMLYLSEKQNILRVVADQFGGPTPARDIAAACVSIAMQLQVDPNKSGVYHFSSFSNVNWFNFAKEIFNLSGRKVSLIPILTVDYPTQAKRPLNSCLDCSTTKDTFGIIQPNWRLGLNTILKELDIIS